MIEVRRLRGDDDVARSFVAAMEAWVTENFGPATPDRTSTVSGAEMVPPDGCFVVVWEDGDAVAGGGVRRLEDGVGEIKRMFVMPDARRRGHARRVLEELEAAAAALGYRRLRLDTAQSMTAAVALYRSAGYRDIPDYNGNSYASYWGEKDLTAGDGRTRRARARDGGAS
jgi:ribosomal protein S18 acetylase RimI-like enzyme